MQISFHFQWRQREKKLTNQAQEERKESWGRTSSVLDRYKIHIYGTTYRAGRQTDRQTSNDIKYKGLLTWHLDHRQLATGTEEETKRKLIKRERKKKKSRGKCKLTAPAKTDTYVLNAENSSCSFGETHSWCLQEFPRCIEKLRKAASRTALHCTALVSHPPRSCANRLAYSSCSLLNILFVD